MGLEVLTSASRLLVNVGIEKIGAERETVATYFCTSIKEVTGSAKFFSAL